MMVHFRRSLLWLTVVIPLLMTRNNCGAARLCNGLASNCDKRLTEAMFPTVHNAMSSQKDRFLYPNNFGSLEEAVEAGFRGLLIDSCDCSSLRAGVQLCHTFCWSGMKSPREVFGFLVKFLNDNPNEVMIIELQVNDNSLDGLWESVETDFKKLLYEHTSPQDDWPTLGDLIDLNQRIIVFQHGGPGCSQKAGNCPVGVHDTFHYFFETDWELLGAEDLLNFDKSCTVRTGNISNQFMLSNHFAKDQVRIVVEQVDVPSSSIAEIVNTKENLNKRIDACYERLNRKPNLLSVDFWSLGDVLEVVDENNRGGASQPVSTPSPTSHFSPIGCFSGSAKVDIEHQGARAMRDLKLGDKVLVSDGKYEPIYSFGHANATALAIFLHFLPSQLELSPNHLVFVLGRGAIPASMVHIGDIFRGTDERVTQILEVSRQGIYAPFTPSGKIIVNGVLASNYIAFQDSPSVHVGPFSTRLSWHRLSHVIVKLLCIFFLLPGIAPEKYNEEGISTWLEWPFKVVLWLSN